MKGVHLNLIHPKNMLIVSENYDINHAIRDGYKYARENFKT